MAYWLLITGFLTCHIVIYCVTTVTIFANMASCFSGMNSYWHCDIRDDIRTWQVQELPDGSSRHFLGEIVPCDVFSHALSASGGICADVAVCTRYRLAMRLTLWICGLRTPTPAPFSCKVWTFEQLPSQLLNYADSAILGIHRGHKVLERGCPNWNHLHQIARKHRLLHSWIQDLYNAYSTYSWIYRQIFLPNMHQ